MTRCPLGSPRCPGELKRLLDPQRYVCTRCARIFDVQTVRLLQSAETPLPRAGATTAEATR